MKPYKTYKDSGLEWLGQIPVHWKSSKLKYHTSKIIDGAHFTPTYIDDKNGVPFLRVTDIHKSEIDIENVKRIPVDEHKELIKRCFPQKGDLLLSKNGTIGLMKIVDWDWDFSIFVSLCLIKFEKTLLNSFFYYFFKSNVVERQIFESSQKTSVTNLHLEKIKELRITIPSLKEQNQIANYLNHKTEQLDSLIAKKEQLIKLLEEERKAIINQAVTKGINPNVPMKDSGIEWLGEIPEHWEVSRINFLSSKVGDGLHGTPNYVNESDYAFINGNNIGKGELIFTEKTKFVSEEEYLKNQKELTPNTLLMSINGTIGNLAFYKGESIMLGKSAAYINLLPNVNKEYIYFYLKSRCALDYISKELSGSTIKNLSLYSINKTPVPFPSIKEQLEIVSFIKKESNEINSILSMTKKEINLLKEYKTALISEVVTGKIDVREEVLN